VQVRVRQTLESHISPQQRNETKVLAAKADVSRDDFQRRFAMQMKLHKILLAKVPVAVRIVVKNRFV
jgi:transcriptional regulator GlxA family with amidase domain